ncbi:hypothetical protein FA95DRAFT_614384 [Auriscalpium vulgare]|uniref:Uncharacterized protein n=1 Tax=Auriscalpium vulgare TaxID=40419 RepID=A0ACB8RE23_9AGAM|nr:hypothetical protein FA95DRAFT_614384 [Auriscalpium vulgare]
MSMCLRRRFIATHLYKAERLQCLLCAAMNTEKLRSGLSEQIREADRGLLRPWELFPDFHANLASSHLAQTIDLSVFLIHTLVASTWSSSLNSVGLVGLLTTDLPVIDWQLRTAESLLSLLRFRGPDLSSSTETLLAVDRCSLATIPPSSRTLASNATCQPTSRRRNPRNPLGLPGLSGAQYRLHHPPRVCVRLQSLDTCFAARPLRPLRLPRLYTSYFALVASHCLRIASSRRACQVYPRQLTVVWGQPCVRRDRARVARSLPKYHEHLLQRPHPLQPVRYGRAASAGN